MATRQLRFYGDEILTKPCRSVTDVNDHIRLLLDDMADTLKTLKNSNVLAAGQLAILRRVMVVNTDTGVKKLVNPVIIDQEGLQDCYESCSCVKDISGVTVRPQKVTVEALNENGEKVTLTAEGETARAICHGIDHLDGKLFVNEVVRFNNDPLEGE